MTSRPVRSVIRLAVLLLVALTAIAQVVTGPTVPSTGAKPNPALPGPQIATGGFAYMVTCVIANPPAGAPTAPISFPALSYSFGTYSAPAALAGAQTGRAPAGTMSVRRPLDQSNATLAQARNSGTLFSTVTVTVYKGGAVAGQIVLHNAYISSLAFDSSQSQQLTETVTFAYQSAG